MNFRWYGFRSAPGFRRYEEVVVMNCVFPRLGHPLTAPRFGPTSEGSGLTVKGDDFQCRVAGRLSMTRPPATTRTFGPANQAPL